MCFIFILLERKIGWGIFESKISSAISIAFTFTIKFRNHFYRNFEMISIGFFFSFVRFFMAFVGNNCRYFFILAGLI